MLDIEISIWLVFLIFFLVAAVYSSVGLGGGSSYTALLSVFGFSTASIPLISLSLNLLVTTVASFNYIKRGHLKLGLILPFLIASIPMAWVGGSWSLSPGLFRWILFITLITVVIRIYYIPRTPLAFDLGQFQKVVLSVCTGAILGLIAGIVGIGGGIYLVPLILVLGLGTMKQAAACGAFFIWVNSAVGISSRLQHHDVDLLPYWPLITSVLIGGVLGSYFGSSQINAHRLEKILGLIVIVAVCLLGRTLVFG